MRPVRLRLEGFSAFREPAEVDFDGAGLFALTGPTGSGKSSLIDAMVFALYGSVPRYGDRRAVEPVISLGREEARVAFDFTVGDDPYTAVRVVRRTKTGATTAEARLEGGSETVSGAREVTAAVERLLGLGFDHFTKCVVLPQGDFAEFLHDQGEERRALLRELLDLAVYGRVRSAAEGRARDANRESELLAEGLAELGEHDQGAEEALDERLGALEELATEVSRRLPEVTEAEGVAAAAGERAEHLGERVAQLAALEAPPGAAELGDRVSRAESTLAAAEDAVSKAESALTAAQAAAGEVPPVTALTERLARHAELEGLRLRAQAGAAEVAEAQSRLAEARAAAEAAAGAARVAGEALVAAEREHAAHVLASGLVPGEPCPVCRRPVDTLPRVDEPAGLDELRGALATATAAHEAARRSLAGAESGVASAQASLAEVERLIADKAGALGDETRADVERLAEQARVLAAEVEAARVARTAAEADRVTARAEHTAAVAAASDGWAEFDRVRDRLGDLGPPVPDRSDLIAAWEELYTWAVEASARLAAEAAESRRAAEEAGRTAAAERSRWEERAKRLDVALDGRSLDVGVAVAIESARAARADLARIRTRRAELTDRLTAAGERRAVASELALHLRSNRFEQWLLEEAFGALVDGANGVLDSLTAGAYSLDVEGTEFAVVDHRNADQRRGVRTLSGGETFLVSLALALALAEHLGSLAVDGAARIEATFLDEGFGTLDAEALDLVASVIDELGASGRTVGIVTHVTDLAERIPVRYEVIRRGGTATVARVEA